MANDWPHASSFSTMVQNPQVAFRDKQLKSCEIKRDAKKQPIAISGQFAVVYQAKLQSGSKMAIRVFTSRRDELKDRYLQISAHLAKLKHVSSLVVFEYEEKGVLAANGRRYPIVKMEWVEGIGLFEWVATRAKQGAKDELAAAAQRWKELVARLREVDVAHGDLQHGNILVTPQGEFKLVDYDCMCVPGLVGQRAYELGVVPYQHPLRDSATPLSLDLDNYSALFIYVVLRALAVDPTLWLKHVERHNYDKLLFRPEDFESSSQSELYQELMASNDRELILLTETLFKLRGEHLEEVQPLHSYLFSWALVESCLVAQRYVQAIELADGSGQAVPPALRGSLDLARQSVVAWRQLLSCIKSGDEAGIVNGYQPRLLDNFPAAQDAVKIAQQAAAVASQQQALKTFLQQGKLREAVTLWDQHVQRFGKMRKSIALLVANMESIRQRNQVCDRLLALLSQTSPDPQQLSTANSELQSAGGHPEVASRQAEIQQCIQRASAWKICVEQLDALGSRPSATLDQRFVKVWDQHQSLFSGWSVPLTRKREIDTAVGRLKLWGQAQKLIERFKSSPTADVAKEIRALIDRLPPLYDTALGNDIDQYLERLEAFERLKISLASNACAADIIAGADRLQAVKGDYLLQSLTAQQRAEINLARLRLPKIKQILAIDLRLDLPELDKQLLESWEDRLLKDCPDVDAWRLAYEVAIERRKVLAGLSQAITCRDEAAIYQFGKHLCLVDYPLKSDWLSLIAAAEAKLSDAIALANCVAAGDRDEFIRLFDARLIRLHSDLFVNDKVLLLRWVNDEICHGSVLELRKPIALSSLVAIGNAYMARWTFPHQRFAERCVIGFFRDHRKLGDPRLTPGALTVAREDYRRAGGGRRITSVVVGDFVVVAALVELGALGTHVSQPLLLGRITSGGKK